MPLCLRCACYALDGYPPSQCNNCDSLNGDTLHARNESALTALGSNTPRTPFTYPTKEELAKERQSQKRWKLRKKK